MTKWEYKVHVLPTPTSSTVVELDDLGAKSWELVAMTPAKGPDAADWYFLIFKRPVGPPPFR